MRDFTLQAYQEYIESLKRAYPLILSFHEYFGLNPKPDRFCIIRHDVDRMPWRALRMAELEHRLGLHSTYFFRTKRHTFRPAIIKSIVGLGHEIGYHYESLSDAKGNIDLAFVDFERNLEKIRQITPVCTIAMHGRPLSQFNNLDLWRGANDRWPIKDKLGISGEVYLDIDYSDIVYINDTGRNWTQNKYNRRDRVFSPKKIDNKKHPHLLEYLNSAPDAKLIFQIHPERWTKSWLGWFFQICFDSLSNLIKHFVGASC